MSAIHGDFAELGNDPLWQAFLRAPVGPAETPEQRLWSQEAEKEELFDLLQPREQQGAP